MLSIIIPYWRRYAAMDCARRICAYLIYKTLWQVFRKDYLMPFKSAPIVLWNSMLLITMINNPCSVGLITKSIHKNLKYQ